MEPSSTESAYRPEILSTRERAIVDLAVLGHTDIQVAQRLGISQSTVNSYWVRVRGKLGPLSRTEIVGMVLRYEAGQRQADLVAENARLGEGTALLWSNLAQANADNDALRGLAWHLLALDCLPDAVFVTNAQGVVEYANLQAHRLYHAEPGELKGLPLGEMTLCVDAEGSRESAAAYSLDQGLEPVTLGTERPYYALRRDGTNFRAVYRAERFESPNGRMAVATVRPYLEELDAFLLSLRKPHDSP